MATAYPELLNSTQIKRARSMRTFDEFVTAPLHGFAGANDYWSRASSKLWLAEIALPTLVLNARNDPFIPDASLPRPREVSREVVLEQPAQGGHAGFLVGPAPGNLAWIPKRVLHFFTRGV
jgi:predicted alpha/beta-fold hydrolase